MICISAAALGDHCSFDQVENVVFFPGNQNLSSGCSHQMYGLDSRLFHFDSIVYYLFEDFTLLGKVTSFGICRCPPDMIFVKMFTPADFRRQVYIIKEVKCKNECTGHPGSFFGEPMNKCDLQ